MEIQIELPGTSPVGYLREALNWLLAHGLECELWTRRMHADHVRYLVDYFGDVPLKQINYQALIGYVEDEKKRGISKETIRKRLSTLHMALREAERRELIERIPPWPRIKTDSRPRDDFWTYVQWQAAHVAEEDDDFRAWIDCAWWLGSHSSELALRFRWCDIDFVEHSWVRRNKKSKVKPTKLPMPEELEKLLRERYDLIQPDPRTLVCGRNFGHPNRRLRALCAKADVPSISPNALRRSCCTYLEEKGESEAFQALWLGHAPGSKVTKRHYRRVSPAGMEQAMALLNGTPPTTTEPHPPTPPPTVPTAT